MTTKVHYHIALKDSATGEAIISAGGVCHVAKPGSPDKATLTDKNGAALANPIASSGGAFDFYVDSDVVSSVDLYIMAPGGQFEIRTTVKASGPNEINVDTARKRQLAKIPFSIADSVAATEKDTGFVLPAKASVLDRLHGCGLLVTTAETTGAKTLTAGTLSTQSGGAASGFINGSSTATAGLVTGTNGASFSTNAPYNVDANPAAVNVSYTLVTASVTTKGFLLIPYNLNG